MSKRKTCENCKFFDEYEEKEGGNDAWGTCNRYPPVLFNPLAKEPDIYAEMASTWKQPNIAGNDWCGEFKPIEP